MEFVGILRDLVTPISVGLFMLYVNKRDAKTANLEKEKDEMFYQIINSVDACMSLGLTLAEIIRQNHDIPTDGEFAEKYKRVKDARRAKQEYMEKKAAEKIL